MADRSASVALKLNAGQFKTEAAVVESKVKSVDRAVEELDHDITKIPPDAAKAAASMKLLSDDVGKVGDHFRSIGDKSTSLNLLDTRIKNTRAEVRKLSDEFVKTGDADVFTKLGKSSGDLKALTDLRKKLAKEIEAGAKDGFLDGLVGSLKSPSLMQVGVAIGAILAVPLLASLGGAAIAGGGATVAGLGILGAVLGDPERFKRAWTVVLADVKKQFVDASQPFVGPTLDALRMVGPLIRSWHLDTIFADAAKFVEPLTQGLAGAGSGLMAGIGDLVKNGGPAVEALSDGMERLGQAAGNALSSISSQAQGGADALHDLVTVLSLIIEGFGKTVEGAEFLYEFMRNHPWMTAPFTGGLSLLIGYVADLDTVSSRFGTTQLGLAMAAREAGHAFNEQAEDLTVLNQTLSATQLSTDSLAASMVSKIFAATMGVDQATLSWHQSMTRLNDTLKENIRTHQDHVNAINEDTAKGQENVAVIYQAVTANMQQYQAMIAAGASAESAAAAYDKNTAALEAQLRKAGLTAGQIDELIGKYRGVPAQVNTTIAVEGLTKAINDLAELIRKINGIHDKDFTITEHIRTVDQRGNVHSSRETFNAKGGVRYAQTGLIIPPSHGGTVIAAEAQTGGEALIPLRGISQKRAMDLMEVAGAGYGLDVVPRWRGAPPHGRPVGGTDLSPLVAELRGLRDDNSRLRAALSGMVVMMDGQRVGEVQGRGADLFRRGG